MIAWEAAHSHFCQCCPEKPDCLVFLSNRQSQKSHFSHTGYWLAPIGDWFAHGNVGTWLEKGKKTPNICTSPLPWFMVTAALQRSLSGEWAGAQCWREGEEELPPPPGTRHHPLFPCLLGVSSSSKSSLTHFPTTFLFPPCGSSCSAPANPSSQVYFLKKQNSVLAPRLALSLVHVFEGGICCAK